AKTDKPRGRPRKTAETSEEQAPAAAAVAEPVQAEDKPAKTTRKSAIKADNANRIETTGGRDGGARDNKRGRSRKDDLGDAPVGFGDDMPDFMKVVVKV
ncbi:MAG: ATP-dependent helicase, partial [Nitratireductor sp.]